ncbi:hypothetical protein Tco_0769289 [Tanacetum coccineum]|uniref:Uncharacterized protein n=1 Tax=Tanacetum coccineum TaxID=301880 RepID=A0ABQ4Z923_9ASTR
MVMMTVVVWWVSGGGGKWRVRESGSGDRVDRPTRSLFGLAGKIPPEKFSGGGEWWPAAGELAGEEGGEGEENESSPEQYKELLIGGAWNRDSANMRKKGERTKTVYLLALSSHGDMLRE